jgi:acetyl esterase/lipase
LVSPFSPWLNLLCNSPSYVSNAYTEVAHSDLIEAGDTCPAVVSGTEGLDEETSSIDPSNFVAHQTYPTLTRNGDVAFPLAPFSNYNSFVPNARAYTGDVSLRNFGANPLFATPDQLTNLPPVQMHTALNEARRDRDVHSFLPFLFLACALGDCFYLGRRALFASESVICNHICNHNCNHISGSTFLIWQVLASESVIWANQIVNAGGFAEVQLYDSMFHVFPMSKAATS